MRARAKRRDRLVKSNVPIVPNAQQLQIDSASFVNLILVPRAESVDVFGHAVRRVHVFGDNVDMIEQLVFHEITVSPIALIVIRIIFLDQDRNTKGVGSGYQSTHA